MLGSIFPGLVPWRSISQVDELHPTESRGASGKRAWPLKVTWLGALLLLAESDDLWGGTRLPETLMTWPHELGNGNKSCRRHCEPDNVIALFMPNDLSR